MKQLKTFAVAAAVIFAPTLAMALTPPQSSALRSRPAGSVIDVILDRDGAGGSHDDSEWRDASKRNDKAARKAAKRAAKQQKEYEKDLRKSAHEREKDRREAAREREKDYREAARERAKDARERSRD